MFAIGWGVLDNSKDDRIGGQAEDEVSGGVGAGGFGKLTGRTYIELVQAIDRKGSFIFKDRIWCDIGFAHLGFDVRGMADLGTALDRAGFGFRCDTADAIGMGETTMQGSMECLRGDKRAAFVSAN